MPVAVLLQVKCRFVGSPRVPSSRPLACFAGKGRLVNLKFKVETRILFGDITQSSFSHV